MSNVSDWLSNIACIRVAPLFSFFPCTTFSLSYVHTDMFFSFHFDTNNVFTLTGLHVHQCIPLTLLWELHTACCFQLSSYAELLAHFSVSSPIHRTDINQVHSLPHTSIQVPVCVQHAKSEATSVWSGQPKHNNTRHFVNCSLVKKVETNGCNTGDDELKKCMFCFLSDETGRD